MGQAERHAQLHRRREAKRNSQGYQDLYSREVLQLAAKQVGCEIRTVGLPPSWVYANTYAARPSTRGEALTLSHGEQCFIDMPESQIREWAPKREQSPHRPFRHEALYLHYPTTKPSREETVY